MQVLGETDWDAGLSLGLYVVSVDVGIGHGMLCKGEQFPCLEEYALDSAAVSSQ